MIRLRSHAFPFCPGAWVSNGCLPLPFMLLELAAFHIRSVEVACTLGAGRIELCTSYTEGGVTPGEDFFARARRAFHGPIFVMIRPRSGDFFYSPGELENMRRSIRRFRSRGADGFVLGCLKGNAVDQSALSALVEAAGGKPVTFHRAIDQTGDFHIALAEVIACGCSRVLTSGRAATASEGASVLAQAIGLFGARIGFVAGGGVRSTTAGPLLGITGLNEIHSAAITGPGEVADPREVTALLQKIHGL